MFIFKDLSTMKKQLERSVLRKLLRTSQHSQLISQAVLFATSYPRVDLKRKAFILRNVLELGIGIIKTPKHCRSALPRIRSPAPFSLRFFSRIRVGGPSSRGRYVTQLTKEDEYFTWRCKRTVTKQRTALAVEAMHSNAMAKYASYVLGVASQFCPDVHAAL